MLREEKQTTDVDTLPKLGLAPYVELINQTVADGANKDHAKLGLMLLWFSDYFLDAIDLELEPLGITESKLDLLILLTLHSKRRATPSALADRLGIARASTTSMIDWLEKRKLVMRNHDTLDRRRVYVELTEEGVQLVNQALPIYWSFFTSNLEDINVEERVVLEKLMNRMIIKLQNKVNAER